MQTFFFKMASVTNTSNLKSLTVEELIEGVFADANSADEAITSESETETSTSEEDDESEAPPTKTHQNNACKRSNNKGWSFKNFFGSEKNSI